MAAAYRGEAWALGPGPAYDAMASSLVALSPVPFTGGTVVDLGAGSGAVSRAVLAAGADVVALDVSLDMLRHDRSTRPPAVVGDACRLPFPDDAFDVAVGAFVLSHVADPARLLAEAGRVVRPCGGVLASSFSARWKHPSKAQIEEVAARWGWRPPPWYERMKAELDPMVADEASIAALAAEAGLGEVVVEEREVDTGVCSPEALVSWRLGMAQLAPFVASLPPADRSALVAEARAAVGPRPQPLRPVVLMLSSRVPAARVRASA